MCWTLGYHRTCTFALQGKFCWFAYANLANASVCSLFFWGTLVILKFVNLLCKSFYFHRICCHFSIPHFKFLYHLPNHLLTVTANRNRRTPSLVAKFRPVITALYSAPLFVVGNLKCNECSIYSKFGPIIMIPGLDPSSFEDLSTKMFQSTFCRAGCLDRVVSSVIKSTRASALIAVIGLNSISNSLKSIANFNNILEVSVRCKIYLTTWSIITCTMWDRKYGLNFLTTTINTNTSCSLTPL